VGVAVEVAVAPDRDAVGNCSWNAWGQFPGGIDSTAGFHQQVELAGD